MSLEIGITVRFSRRFSNNCYFTGSFKFATPIGKIGNLKADSLASKLMPVELNSVDISQNGLHQNDFPVHIQEFQNVNFSQSMFNRKCYP